MTQAVHSDHLSLRVSIAKYATDAIIHVITLLGGHATAIHAAGRHMYPPISVCVSWQLHHPFRPASTQLLRRRSCPPLRASQSTPEPTAVTAAADDAYKAANGRTLSVKAAFSEAGLSQDAIDDILTQYPSYLRWDVEQKLLAAMQQKQQELGARFPSELRRIPKMLLLSTESQAKAQTARKAAKAKAASGNAVSVKTAFTEAGLSENAVDHIVRQYPTYLRWKVEDKLLPAIQSWQQELGKFPVRVQEGPNIVVYGSSRGALEGSVPGVHWHQITCKTEEEEPMCFQAILDRTAEQGGLPPSMGLHTSANPIFDREAPRCLAAHT